MDASARPPLRLSVEERVDHAVSSAVRRALSEQRKTQEEELDALSDVVQRSLAALAGERDRALRSLAAEEDRRRDMVEDLSGLLGAELSPGDVSRLAMGLERIEREEEEEEEEEEMGRGTTMAGGGEPKGRAWVLEQLRQCLYARAAAQDHLRSSADKIAADLFEAEEGLMGFELGPGGGGDADTASPISCPPPPHSNAGGGGRGGALWSARSEGIARARAAAAGALDTSLRLARERVDQLEALVLEVKGKKATGRAVGAGGPGAVAGGALGAGGGVSLAEGVAQGGGRGEAEGEAERGRAGTTEPGALVDEKGVQPPHAADGGGVAAAAAAAATAAAATASAAGDGSGDEAVEAGDRGTPSSDGSWSFLCTEQEGSVGAARDAESTPRGLSAARASGANDGGGGSGGGGGGAGAVVTAGTPGDTRDHGQHGQGPPEHESATPRPLSSARGTGSRFDEEGHGRCRSVPESCGESDGEAADGGGSSAQARGQGVPAAVAGAREAERWRMAALRSEAALADLRETLGDVVALSFRCGEDSARRRIEDGELKEEQEESGDREEGGSRRQPAGRGGGEDPRGALALAGEAGVGDAPAAATAAESRVSEGRAGEDGKGGTCCGGRRRCRLCEAKAAAVGVLLKRLEALSADQGKDVARLAASLQIPPRAAAPRAAPTAVAPAAASDARPPSSAPGSEAGRRSSGHSGGEEEEKAAAAAAAAAVTAVFGASAAGAEEQGASRDGAVEKRGTGSRDASPKRDIRTEWEEVDELDTYLAHYQGGGGLGSQAVQGVLDRWIDVSKRHILEGWLGHVLHGGPVDAANGSFVPRVQMSSLSKEVRDGMVTVVLPLLLGRRGVLLQVLTRERVEIVHDIQIRVTSVAGRREQQSPNISRPSAASVAGRRRRPQQQGQGPVGEREHGARIRDMVMKAAHVGFVDEEGDGGSGDGGAGAAWRAPLSSVDSLSRQLKDTWENFNANFTAMGDRVAGGGEGGGAGHLMLPEY